MIENIFRKLCSNIEIDQDYILRINQEKANITQCLDEYYGCCLARENSQFIGSFGRGTAVYVENIRLLTVIPEEMYWSLSMGIDRILKEMKTALMNRYLSCEYSSNGNGLNININGSLSFEVIPGFRFNNGVYVYLCNSAWKRLQLDTERRNFQETNKMVNNNLVELCRILKVWKNCHDLDVSNILLDSIAYRFMKYQSEKQYSVNQYDEMLVDFFRYFMDNSKSDTFLSLDEETVLHNRVDISERVFFSATTAQAALSTANCGMIEESIKDWKRVLGYSMF